MERLVAGDLEKEIRTFSTIIKQILRNFKQLKSYKVYSLTIMELNYKSVKDNRGRLGGSVDEAS